MADLKIGGITPLSTTDYPGHLSAVIFCQGCPWRCRYCHNPHLIPNDFAPELSFNDLLSFLEKRIGLLDAVVLSGGEPTMQPSIVDAAEKIFEMGFKVALHTGGQYPKILEKLLPYLSWIGMDIKAPFTKYKNIVQKQILSEKIALCIRHIVESGLDHEFRTTIHNRLLSKEDIIEIGSYLKEAGARKYVLQQFRASGCLDSDLCEAYTDLSEFKTPEFSGFFELRE